MAKKPKVLCVFFEGLDNSVIDSQVLTHARVMKNLGVAEFELVCCAWDADIYAKSIIRQREAEVVAQAPVHVLKACRPGLPFSSWLNRRRLDRFVRKQGGGYTHVHARTDYSTTVVGKWAKKWGASLIWDCRGDSVAELEFRVDLNPAMRLLRRVVLSRRMHVAAKVADQAIFVSHPLHDKMWPLWGGKPCQVIPCTASSQKFFFDEQLRRSVRNRFEITDGQSLYIYGGSMALYQKFRETVEMFSRIRKTDSQAVLLVLTHDQEKARAVIGQQDGVILLSAKNEDMNGYLNAADAAFMLRDHVATNIVAFPTKFAEYGLAGLPVIMTDAVADAYKMAHQVGNMMDVSHSAEPGPIPNVDRKKTMEAYQSLVTKQAYADAYRLLYS